MEIDYVPGWETIHISKIEFLEAPEEGMYCFQFTSP
jgi:hypothetical protein